MIQLHTTRSLTGVGTYVHALNEGLDTVETHTFKKEWVVFGKRVGGYLSQVPSSWLYPKKEDLMHSTCNWSYSLKCDSVMIHDLNPFILPEFWTARFMFMLQKPSLKDKILFTPTHSVKEGVMRWLKVDPEQVTVAHHGYDTELFKPIDIDYGFKYLVYAGDYRPYKRIDEGIRLAHKLGLHLIRVGPLGKTAYAKSVKDLGWKLLGNKFHDYGYVPREQLPIIYSGATASWFASKWEGFGLPVLEAAACGTPAILADTPVAHEVHRETGIWNPKSLADLEVPMKDLLSNARRFSWDRSVKIHHDRWKMEGLI